MIGRLVHFLPYNISGLLALQRVGRAKNHALPGHHCPIRTSYVSCNISVSPLVFPTWLREHHNLLLQFVIAGSVHFLALSTLQTICKGKSRCSSSSSLPRHVIAIVEGSLTKTLLAWRNPPEGPASKTINRQFISNQWATYVIGNIRIALCHEHIIFIIYMCIYIILYSCCFNETRGDLVRLFI